MYTLAKFKEMVDFIGQDPLEYMKKYPEIINLILKQYKIKNYFEINSNY